ncbi:cytochrome P450 [Goodfellowiella coeruleoviolacea]|uniref:Cytochrome P450 n=1 Tax=Goodfellowiella coeruleoviolacea TaxID=334858 RepID=A0AAE3GK23_9PSEU|nr:cytochrome P450 [Goodfellowiella coeruleoviolacea]MCP2169646.1 Cytochrome P450 [Goodfellowiella coeruleoviolacea]
MTTNQDTRTGDLSGEFASLRDWCDQLRATDPVHRDERGVWHLFRHADVSAALADAATFSSETSAFLPAAAEGDAFRVANLTRMDPPRHRAMRGLVSTAFTPRLVSGLAPRISALTSELLDALAEASRLELVDALTYPLPVIVISELLGVPTEDRGTFRDWVDVLLSLNVDRDNLAASQQAVRSVAPTRAALIDYLRGQVDRRRVDPGEDLISALLAAEADGARLTEGEIVGLAATLLIAGHITTTGLLGNAMLLFDQHPEVVARLRDNRELLPSAIEEVLRVRPPFSLTMRATTREVELGGRTLPANQLVFLWLLSANRDETVFAEPDRFDLDRRNSHQLAFGRGIHFCLGAPLARLEARIALDLLLDRYAEFRVATDEPVEFYNPLVVNGPKRLPLLVTPA